MCTTTTAFGQWQPQCLNWTGSLSPTCSSAKAQLWTTGQPNLNPNPNSNPNPNPNPHPSHSGNLFFSPLNPKEDVSLICLDAATGARKWTLPGAGPSYGAPLILNDPSDPRNHEHLGGGRQIVYHSTRLDSYAVDTQSGDILWHTTPNLPPVSSEYSGKHHTWGLNYHAQADAIIGVMLGGEVFVASRKTGQPLSASLQLPCARATPSQSARPAWWLVDRANKETDKAFGKLPSGRSLFENIMEVIFGGGACVANFFVVDQNTGRILIAATAPDEQDGKVDGYSDNGALYSLRLVPAENPTDQSAMKLEIVGEKFFQGGTGSTPSLSANGRIVYVSDDQSNVIALNSETLETLWQVDVFEQVAASLAVAADNNEIFAITQTNVIKIQETFANEGDEHPNGAHIAWIANLDAYPGVKNVNTLTPTITANGIAISMGSVLEIEGKALTTNNGMGLLDRETGNLRYFAEGREDSISVTVVDRDGAYYQGHSPVRRAASRAILGDKLKPLIGGVSRFKPIRKDLLVRDAICAAAGRLQNMVKYMAAAQQTAPRNFYDDARQVEGLLQQALRTDAYIHADVENGRSDTTDYQYVGRDVEAAISLAGNIWSRKDFSYAQSEDSFANLMRLDTLVQQTCDNMS
jgi:outer membrane protein assembly factor BamB